MKYTVKVLVGKDYGLLSHFQQYFSFIVAVSIIGGGTRETHDLPTRVSVELLTIILNFF
jgi:hypothetical protein